MGGNTTRRSELIDEVDAFRLGFGSGQSLTDAVRKSALLVPVADDHLLVVTMHGLDWICAFTDEHQYVRYRAARAEFTDAGFQRVLGWRIFDTLLPTLSRPTGVLLDIAGVTPLGFAPEASSMELVR